MLVTYKGAKAVPTETLETFVPKNEDKRWQDAEIWYKMCTFAVANMTDRMDTNVTKALLRCPLFEGLTAEEIEQTMATVSHRLVRFDRNDVYTLAGSPCRYADIIVEGEMTARMVGPSGKFVQMAARGVGTLLAPAFIFSKDNRMPVSIETNRATTVLRMTPDSLRQLMQHNERIQMNFIRQLSTVSQFLAKKVRILTLHTVREKVAIFLLEESRKRNTDTFTLTKSRQEIADSFAIQKFSLQRCLNEFVADGAILLNGKTITILNREKVMAYANSKQE